MSIRSRICTSRYGVLRCSDDHGISILQHLAKGLWKDLTDPHKPSSCTCSLPACDGGVALHINRGNSNCNNSKCNNSKCSNSKCSKHSNSSNSSNMGVGVWVSGAEICLCIFLAMSFSDCLFCGTCIYTCTGRGATVLNELFSQSCDDWYWFARQCGIVVFAVSTGEFTRRICALPATHNRGTPAVPSSELDGIGSRSDGGRMVALFQIQFVRKIFRNHVNVNAKTPKVSQRVWSTSQVKLVALIQYIYI